MTVDERRRASSGGAVIGVHKGDEVLAELTAFPDGLLRMYIVDLTRAGSFLVLEHNDVRDLARFLKREVLNA